MDEHDRQIDRGDERDEESNAERQRGASKSSTGGGADDLSRRRAEHESRILTQREREERWPVG
jgi:hypothetical protein